MLLGLNQALLVLTDIPVEERSPLYLIRLTAFLLIIFAVLRKNVRSKRRPLSSSHARL